MTSMEDNVDATEVSRAQHGIERQMSTSSNGENELLISSLKDSLQMHKEIVERIQEEKEKVEAKFEEYMARSEKDLNHLKEQFDQVLRTLEDRADQCRNLEVELDKRNQAYKLMESNFYDHMRTIRATDDDLSTVQQKINALLTKMSNLCQSLKSKVDRTSSTTFIFEHWPSQATHRETFSLSKPDDTLSPGIITIFAEKLIMEVLVRDVLTTPVHPGVSINTTFGELLPWIETRNKAWAKRWQQQVTSLAAKDARDEQSQIEGTREAIVECLLSLLSNFYPDIRELAPKVKSLNEIANMAFKLDLAMKSQDMAVCMITLEEGKAEFDDEQMIPAGAGKPEGTVRVMISPIFEAVHPDEPEYKMHVSAKVLCL